MKEDNIPVTGRDSEGIEITKEMIEAGLKAYYGWLCDEDSRLPYDDKKVESIFLAMYAARSDKKL